MKPFVPSRRGLYVLAATLLLSLGFYALLWITSPAGDQRVSFVRATEDCGSSGPLRYCIYRARSGTNGDIVYHLPGRNLSERVWNDNTYWTAMVQAEWQRARIVPPTVVTLSYGQTWLLVPKGKQADSGLLEDVLARMPEIEAKAGGARRRMLLGESMGGLNVLIAGLSRPTQFARIAALCPGVYATSPFAPLADLRKAAERTGADPKIAFGVWLMARRYVADDQEWQRVSPLALIERVQPPYPALLLSNGLYDAYGNFEGTERLAAAAARRGVPVEWHPLYGGHCAIDPTSVARFLTS